MQKHVISYLKKIPYLRKFKTGLLAFFSYPIYFISGLIPRNNNIWIFGSFGIFNDNSKYMYIFLNEDKNYTHIRPIWISRNKQSVNEAKKYGGEAYFLYSFRGVYYCLTGKVFIFSAYISDICFSLSRNALKINLWHGIPLKKIEFDITTPPLVHIFQNANILQKLANPQIHMVKYDLVLAPSQYVADYSFKSAFRITNSEIVVAEYPRVTHLKNCFAINRYDSYQSIILYAPTWRDNNKDFLLKSGIDFNEINKLMKSNNSIFLLKFHSSTNLDIDLNDYSHIEIIENSTDPIELLKTATHLVTDYSSIYFDYMILNRKVLFFPFDMNEYLSNREFYFQYQEVVPANIYFSFEDLLNALKFSIIEATNLNNNCNYLNKNPNINKFIDSENKDYRHIVERITNLYI